MRTAALTSFALISVVLASTAAPALTGWHRWLPTVSGNLAITKERAERGDVKSQVELADNLAANQLAAQAVVWYRAAAEQGNVEAKFRLGEILFNGSGTRPVPLAIINGRTLEQGDSVAVPVKEGSARVTCVKTTRDSVLVTIEGEDEPRVLHLR